MTGAPDDQELGFDGGWTASAEAWIRSVTPGDVSRLLLLDPIMLDLCGDVAGRRVLDLGCGEGRFARFLVQRGAQVVALDLVRGLLERGCELQEGAEQYVVGNGDRLPFGDESFDLVVSYLTLIDISDFRAAIAESARVLRSGGLFVIANLSFVTASLGWLRDEEGRRLFHRIDRYLEERAQVFEWAGIRIRNWHRPLSAYMEAYLGAGLKLVRFLEPVPQDDSLRADPRLEDWYRVPDFTVMVWQKE